MKLVLKTTSWCRLLATAVCAYFMTNTDLLSEPKSWKLSVWMTQILLGKVWCHCLRMEMSWDYDLALFLGYLTSWQHAKCVSVIDMRRQLYMLPHWERSWRESLLFDLVTVDRCWPNQYQLFVTGIVQQRFSAVGRRRTTRLRKQFMTQERHLIMWAI